MASVHRRRRAVGVGEVAFDGRPPICVGDSAGLVDEPIEDRDGGALGGERGGDRLADARDPPVTTTRAPLNRDGPSTAVLAPHDHDSATS